MIASAMLENKNRTYEYYKILNPIEHTRTKEAVLKYKVEPYVIAADIYSASGMVGRGGWTWYTGSSSWYYLATLEYLLGIKKDGEYISFNPIIPDEWEEFEVKINYENLNLLITVYNRADTKNQDIKIYCDNQKITGNKILVNTEISRKIDIVL